MIPNRTRNAVMVRSLGRCEDCGCRAKLELHHLRYFVEPTGEPIDGHETPKDLLALCRFCHRHKHESPLGFVRDPEEADAQRDWWWEQVTKD